MLVLIVVASLQLPQFEFRCQKGKKSESAPKQKQKKESAEIKVSRHFRAIFEISSRTTLRVILIFLRFQQ